ncbi:MAG: hypothetical protein M3068_09530 [Gemmatimonadota bacterium]|nr:hypothetical protein [Gemmatimonadota bacterium]
MPVAELLIGSIAAGGDGVARTEPDGLVVFVPRTAPGDVVVADITPHGSFARGRVRELRVPSAQRVEPLCAHYVTDRCGGCQLQHLDYDAQRSAKAKIIRDALVRIGRRDVSAREPEVRPSAPWRYRRKLTLALRRRAGADDWIAGLHPYDAPGRVFEMRECPITDARVLIVWREILAAGQHLPLAHELRGAVRLDGESASFVVSGGSSWTDSATLFGAVPSLASLWWEPERGQRRLLHQRRADEPPGVAFGQVNARVAEDLQRHVLDRILAHRPVTVIDAYAGVGEVAVALAAQGVRVTAIEIDADAARWSAARLPTGSRSVLGRAEEELPAALPADVVLLNPPRAGARAEVTSALTSAIAGVRCIVYVSCNPATLARDLSRLPGWRIESLVGFDMFPQTAHVETVCELVRVAA